jgi:isoleucyl-tRNA synthetase
MVTRFVEELRREKKLGSSLEAAVEIRVADPSQIDLIRSVDFAEICITASADVLPTTESGDGASVVRTAHHKCGRCWRLLPEVTEDGALCDRCEDVVAKMDAVA